MNAIAIQEKHSGLFELWCLPLLLFLLSLPVQGSSGSTLLPCDYIFHFLSWVHLVLHGYASSFTGKNVIFHLLSQETGHKL